MTRASLNLGIASALLLILLGAYVVWYGSVRNLSAQAASLDGQITARQQDSARAASARRALDSIASDESALASHFVSAGNVVPYLEGLESQGSSLGTKIDVGSVSQESAPQPHLALSLSIKGSFADVMRTLGTIEYGPVDAQVSNVTLDSVPGAEGAAPVWTAAVTMSVGMESGGKASSTPAASAPAAPPVDDTSDDSDL